MRAYIVEYGNGAKFVTYANTWDGAFETAEAYNPTGGEDVEVVEYNYSEHGDSRDYREI